MGEYLQFGSAGAARAHRGGKAVLVVALVAASVRDGVLRIDPKFHLGMLAYVARMGRPLACLLPAAEHAPAGSAMDSLEIPTSDVPYRIHLVPGGGSVTDAAAALVIEEAVSGACVVSLGPTEPLNHLVAARCRALGVPYVVVTENTLRTELDIMRASTPSRVRRLARTLRLVVRDRAKRKLVEGAAEVHANGYPTYHELAAVNPHRLLFFDSRSEESDVIPETDVDRRLADLDRPARLIFSGRYHPIKGSLDVVRAGLTLRDRGVRMRLDLYGQGPLRDEMRAEVARANAGDDVVVHDPVPFKPDLVETTRRADIFLCAHVQGDPSCTYLETLAAGVPIVGYANEMWTPLCEASGAGRVVPTGDVKALAAEVESLLHDRGALAEASRRGRRFALEHCMERAWDARTSRLEAVASSRAVADARSP